MLKIVAEAWRSRRSAISSLWIITRIPTIATVALSRRCLLCPWGCAGAIARGRSIASIVVVSTLLRPWSYP